jgi:hypothetical protein
MMKDELDPGSRGWRSRRIGTSGEAVEVGAVHLNHRLLMEEGSGGGRKERSELEQIPSVASGRMVVMEERGSARGRGDLFYYHIPQHR